MFGLTQLKKGFFPHTFNTPKNFNYVGVYPSRDYYEPNYMPEDKRNEFDEWYLSVKYNEFDFQKELYEYCWSDVELLSAGCLEYGRINEDSSKLNDADLGIHPFKTCLTKSSYCNALYRRNFMPEKSIAWFPSNGFNPKEKTSRKADQWLKFVSEKEQIFIRHSKNGGKKKLGPYKVDGYCRNNKTIYEFHGMFNFFNSIRSYV